MPSLCEALLLADTDSSTADRIEFATAVQGQRITLSIGQFTTNSDLTIDGAAGVIINANLPSRVILVRGLGTEAMLQSLTITGGRTTANMEGRAGLRADAEATLKLGHVTVIDKCTTGAYGYGGGIFGESVELNTCIVTGNSTAGRSANGGGISGDHVTVANSTVIGNSTAGYNAGVPASKLSELLR